MKKYLKYIVILLVNIPFSVHAATVQPFVDLLEWRAAESNSSWATTLSSQGTTTNVFQSSINFHTAPGIRAGLSFLPDNQSVDTTFYWTHFATSQTNRVKLNNQIITSLFFSGSFFISNDLFFAGSADWKMIMNMFDLEMSHSFKPTSSLTFIPKIGLKGGSINQEINAKWNAILYTSTENVNNNFTGIGPSFGVDGQWNFFKEFNLVGDISTALMYGRWHVNDTYRRPSAFFGLITPTTISTHMNYSKLGAFMMNYYLGLEWLHPGKTSVAMRLGYEAQYWPGQLRLITVQQLPTYGDLTIQGLTCGISVGF